MTSERIDASLSDDLRVIVPSALGGCAVAALALRLLVGADVFTAAVGQVLVGGPLLAVVVVGAGVLLTRGRPTPTGWRFSFGRILEQMFPVDPMPEVESRGHELVSGRDIADLAKGGGQGPPALRDTPRPMPVDPGRRSVDPSEPVSAPWAVAQKAVEETLALATAGSSAESSAGPGPPPITSAVRVAQCPSCGNHRLDVRLAAGVFAFTCPRTGCLQPTWTWSRGSPWPDPPSADRAATRFSP